MNSRKTAIAVVVVFASVTAAVVGFEFSLRLTSAILGFRPPNYAVGPSRHNLVVLGDYFSESTTDPEDHRFGKPDSSWPAALEIELKKRGYVGFNVDNRAASGATIDEQVETLREYIDRRHPELVVAMLGLYDWGYPLKTNEKSRFRVVELIRRSIRLLCERFASGYNSAAMEFVGDVSDKVSYLDILENVSDVDSLQKKMRARRMYWNDDKAFRFRLVNLLNYKALVLCDDSHPCLDVEKKVFDLSKEAVLEGDRNPAIFHFLVASGIALNIERDLRPFIKARLQKGLPISLPTRPLVDRIAATDASLRPFIAKGLVWKPYEKTREAIATLVELCRESGTSLVLLQYPRAPLGALTALLEPDSAPTSASYPGSFLNFIRTDANTVSIKRLKSGVFVASVGSMNDDIGAHAYEAFFTDRSGFLLGVPFGRLTPHGSEVFASHLVDVLAAQGLFNNWGASQEFGDVFQRGNEDQTHTDSASR